jgi:hypothetical protein
MIAAAASGLPVFSIDEPLGGARPLAQLVEAAGDEPRGGTSGNQAGPAYAIGAR